MEITHKKPGLTQTENKDITLGAAYKLMEKMQASDTITPVNFINHKKETSEQVLATSKLAMVVNIGESVIFLVSMHTGNTKPILTYIYFFRSYHASNQYFMFCFGWQQ
jgi:hypothetical protein